MQDEMVVREGAHVVSLLEAHHWSRNDFLNKTPWCTKN
jgi:hypothetical protein